MVSRPTMKSAKSRFFVFCLFVIVVSAVYLYLMYAQDNLKNMKWAEMRCLAELSSVKYQLDEVTDYKTDVENMLSESKKAHKLDKDKFKDVAESCITMKQQSLLCQNQFDDLQSECKKVRESYNRNKVETDKLKEQLHEKKIKEDSQHTINELVHLPETDTLRKSENSLEERLKSNEGAQGPPFFEGDYKPVSNVKSFSQLIEISPGVYEVGKSTGTAPPTTVKEKVAESNGRNINNIARTKDKSLNHVPPGFAPVLRVVESGENVNLQKPPDVLKGELAVQKPEDRKELKVHNNVEKSNDRYLELAGALPDVKINSNLEDNEGLNAPMDNEKLQLLDDANIGHDPNRHVQEDDDEGEEYGAKYN